MKKYFHKSWIYYCKVKKPDDDVLVEVIYRCGETDTDYAYDFNWSIDGTHRYDILKWRRLNKSEVVAMELSEL